MPSIGLAVGLVSVPIRVLPFSIITDGMNGPGRTPGGDL
jgi:hypothetical protein